LIFTRSKDIHVGGVPFGAELAPIFKGEGQIIRMDPLGWNTGIQGLLSVIAHRPPKGLMDGQAGTNVKITGRRYARSVVRA